MFGERKHFSQRPCSFHMKTMWSFAELLSMSPVSDGFQILHIHIRRICTKRSITTLNCTSITLYMAQIYTIPVLKTLFSIASLKRWLRMQIGKVTFGGIIIFNYKCTDLHLTLTMTLQEPEQPGEGPYFIRAPQPNNVVSGDSAVFECQVAGSPTPQITWYHETVEITITEKHKWVPSNHVP